MMTADLAQRAVEALEAQDGDACMDVLKEIVVAAAVAGLASGGGASKPNAPPAPPAPKPKPPTTEPEKANARAFSTPHGPVTLSPDELATCAEVGAKPEVYAANKTFLEHTAKTAVKVDPRLPQPAGSGSARLTRDFGGGNGPARR